MVPTKHVICSVICFVALAKAVPLEKRIAQVISDSTQQWVQACTAAGGAEKCGTTSQTAFMTLLAGAGDCDQQNAADAMIDLAKSLNNDPKMITLTQVFVQQPRNSPNKLSVNYCQQQPKNAELNGLFQCQFQGVDPNTFTNNVHVGGPGTIPLGLSMPLNPSGSCKANPQGPIAAGSQLVALTQDPGLNNNVGAGSSDSSSGSSSNSTNTPNNSDTPDGNPSNSSGSVSPNIPGGSGSDISSGTITVTSTEFTVTTTVTASSDATGTANCATPTNPVTNDPSTQNGDASGNVSANTSNSDGGASTTASAVQASATGGFQLQNGKDAQALNAKFATLTPSSACNEGEQACVNQGFAQCVGGKFITTQCAGGTQCFALPLVNKAGTSIACTTQSDAVSRIQATGASGGVTGA